MKRSAHPLLQIERHSTEPLYRQVRKAIERGIAVGAFDPDAALPSSRELSHELSLSRNTINTAYQELMAEGFVVTRPRSGLFVNEEMSRVHGNLRQFPRRDPGVEWTRRLSAPLDAGLPEIEKPSDWYTYPYPFVAGQIDSQSFPCLAWLRSLREALQPSHVHYSLRDGIAEDDPLLVDMLCRHILPSRGIEATPDEVLITMGSQEGLELLGRAVLGSGSVAAVEEPGYLDARHIFVRAGARLAPIPVDGAGLLPPNELRGVDLVYVTPSHHHPTNVTLAAGRRHQLLALADRFDCLIVEDDYDSELRYQGSPTPSLKALDDAGRVIYLGTFSKFLAPGLRLGYLVGAAELIACLRHGRRYSVRHPPGHVQRAMALLIGSGQYHRAVRRHRILLQRRWEAMLRAVNAYLPWRTSAPPGGVSIWMTGPPELDCAELVGRALARGVVLERGDVLFLDQRAGRCHFRLGFAAVATERIEPGVQVLSEVIGDLLS